MGSMTDYNFYTFTKNYSCIMLELSGYDVENGYVTIHGTYKKILYTTGRVKLWLLTNVLAGTYLTYSSSSTFGDTCYIYDIN